MMRTIGILSSIAILSAWVGTPIARSATEIVVIVNKANPVKALSKNDLRPIFQTKTLQWPDGSRIEPIDLPDTEALRHDFSATVLGLDPDRVLRYWIDRKIRGGERPPPKLPSPASIVRAVGSKPGAIGYVAVTDINPNVKIVARVRGGDVLPP
jgi:ABC-type phosphate transport system substrate-binding protein